MAARGRTVKDVPADVFVKTLAEHFKKHEKIKAPSYVDVIKTASFKELPPYDADWFFTRAASIARKVYIRGASVGGLSKIYGGKARRGPRENHYSKASEGINRNILQQLEAAKLIQKSDKGGRRITKEGQKELDTIAGQITVQSVFV